MGAARRLLTAGLAMLWIAGCSGSGGSDGGSAPPPSEAAMPVFSPGAGTYSTAQTVTISDATTGATIYYTTDGSTPTTTSTVYSAPITVSSTETIKAIATASGYSTSAAVSATYTISPSTVATPTFSPAAGSYNSPQAVTISDTTPGTTIYYTTDGTMPTTSSTVYSVPITVSATETIEAIAAIAGYSNSSVASATYTIMPSSLIFEDDFTDATLNSIYWNPYVTSNPSGWPWSMQAGQPQPSSSTDIPYGSTLDYDLPSFVSTGSSTNLVLKAQSGSSAEGYSWTGSVISSYPTQNNWGSGVINTPGFTFQDVYVEVKAKMPYSGNGDWPAIWFLAAPGYNGAEIDLFEGGFTLGSVDPDRIFACDYHGGGATQQKTDTGSNISDGYHIFGLEYSSGNYVKMFFDNVLMCSYTTNPPTGEYFLILNHAIAASSTSSYHSQVTASTLSPSYMYVEYVKIYDLASYLKSGG